MAVWMREEHKGLPLLFAGGVMSNRIIADKIRQALGDVYFAEPAFSADNAAGIALLCRARMME
jgi:N6-L-threonylcarbamoyladenine synthase